MIKAGASLPEVRYDTIMPAGGLDQVTPTLSLKSGAVRDAVNYECAPTGGYTRVAGYERYDGHQSPSSATYSILTVNGSTTPSAGSTITGATSGATAYLLLTTPSYFVVVVTSGAFTIGETLNVGGSPVGTYTSIGTAATPYLNAVYTAAAADYYRTFISPPPGSGPCRGVFVYNDITYAFRDNVGATACLLYVSTSSGWSLVPFFEEISFTAGSVAPTEGSTITQGGVTATVKRIVLQSGAWLGGTATGRLIINARTGTFAAGALTSGGTLTLSGASTSIVQQPGGKYQFDQDNLAGSASTIRMYGCDGVNRGFEFDGTTFVPISTGATNDAPSFLVIHKNQLFFAVRSSLMQSGPGLPYNFSALAGASEIAVGDLITGMLIQPGAQTTGTLAVFTNTDTFMLYGTGVSNWNLVHFNTGTGALAYTAQNMSQSYVMDNRGVINLQAVLSYGNFEQSTMTANIMPFIQDKRTRVSCSVLCREKSHYRLFFTDGYGLTITVVNGQNMGCMPFFHPITGNNRSGLFNVWESTLSSGEEVIYGSGVDGYVYRLEKGTSFDGAPINYSLLFPYNATKSPRVLKRFRKASVEVVGTSYISSGFSYNLGYSRTEYAAPNSANYSSNFTTSYWDNFTWDNFTWDGVTIGPTEIEMVGTAENVQLAFNGSSNLSSSFMLNSIIVHYSLRRGIR